MPYQNYPDGLYLIKQKSTNKPGVEHYGILDIGNISNIPTSNSDPIVIHQTPPHIKFVSLSGTGKWHVLGKITDEKIALSRIREAYKNPAYDLFGHNCEHFARFVALGKRESTQLQTASIGLIFTGLCLLD